MKSSTLIILFLIFLTSPLLAREQYALKEGVNCSACHYNPSGGGALNIQGRYYERHDFSLHGYTEYLTSLKKMISGKKDKKDDSSEFIAAALERLSLQGNLRSQFKYTIDRPKDVARDNFDLLDATATFGFQIHDQLTMIYSAELNTLHTSDVYIVGNGPWGTFLRIGRFTAPFGLTSDDPTIMVRSLYGLPYYLKDTGVTLGYEQKGAFLNISVLNAFRQLAAASGGTNSIGDPFRGLGLTANLGFQSSCCIFGFSGLFEATGDKGQGAQDYESLASLYSSISLGPVHLSAEVDGGYKKGIGTGNQTGLEADASPFPVKRATAEYTEPYYGKFTTKNRDFGDISVGAFTKVTIDIIPKRWDVSAQYDMLTGNFEFLGDAPIRITGATKFYPWKNFSLEPQLKFNQSPSGASDNAKKRNKHQFLVYAKAVF